MSRPNFWIISCDNQSSVWREIVWTEGDHRVLTYCHHRDLYICSFCDHIGYSLAAHTACWFDCQVLDVLPDTHYDVEESDCPAFESTNLGE